MSFQYDRYLEEHRANVKKAYDWMCENIPDVLSEDSGALWNTEFGHDQSKYQKDEYEPYDAYFYGRNRSYAVVEAYKRAWLLHIHRNPHHWQHWILINDDPKEGEVVLEMPYEYIIEMICDWWSFSWSKGKLDEIFNWYDEHSQYMRLANDTRKTVEEILEKIYEKISSDELLHTGVKGMKWGVRNGPPYPIQDKEKNTSNKKSVIIKSTRIPEEKFTEYSLNPDKAPDKAKAFKDALGYTKDNYKELIDNINNHFDTAKLEERGDSGYGMRYQQVMNLNGPNGKSANVLTAWIDEADHIRLTSVYVTKKEESK